ncbi:TonB-dependent receptor [Flagellimonas flava]|uniref:TonB-linked outer membrane protein, SusC/RagA family n=1 Tax=Flagellimonas flava TaxID=570519 RepID=A0A1M5NL72_9FLAO|nr:TonB-dependent receptor [Allomuricauda flava]SHG90354.1 TonB-linked outer membrane protein, SusC/RagA family [Allomuricauda flava]
MKKLRNFPKKRKYAFPKFDLKMKISLLLILTVFFQLQAETGYAQKAKITVNMTNASILEVMNEIESVSEFKFFYSSQELDLSRKVSINAKKQRIDNVLRELFSNGVAIYKVIEKQIVLTPTGTSTRVIQPVKQSKPTQQPDQAQVSGTVSDSNGTPLPGANIVEKGTTNGVVTDFDGNFSISIADANATLVVSYIGFEKKEVAVNGQTSINVSLQESTSGLDEVVVIGYGTQAKSDLTGALVSLDDEQINSINAPRVEERLKAQTPGVQISSTSNHPGGTVQIRIRGSNSIQGDNNPLIVIDGLIGGDLTFINPNDIASLEVLKDASATAIYGSRGANGVIIVTTKKGRKGKPTVNLNIYGGVQNVNKKIDLLNANEWTSILNQNPNSINLDGPIAADTDWQDEIFQTAPIQNYQLSVSGGTENTNYLFSLNYFDQEGVIKNADFNRATIRLNLEQKLGKKIRIGNNLSFSRTVNNLVKMNEGFGNDGGPVTFAALISSPAYPVFDESINTFTYNPFEPIAENPVRLVNQRDDVRSTNYLFGNLYGELDIVKGLTYKLNFGYILRDFLQQRYDSRELVGVQDIGFANVNSRNQTDYLLEHTLNYSNTFNEVHNLNVLAGFTTQAIENKGLSTSASGFSSDELGFNGIQLATNLGPAFTFFDRRTLASFLGRINYSYGGKYLLSASFRADGASVFAKNNKWAYFPSASVGWRISQEEFLKDSKTISNLKLRGSYGVTGSQAIQPYQSLAAFQSGVAINFGEEVALNGSIPSRIANNDLKWETTTSYNVGLDLGLFNQRIDFTAEYYYKKTEDLLFDKELPKYTGFSSQVQNIGSMRNEGFEFALNTVNVNSDTFRWNTNFNIFFNENEVLDLGGDENLILSSGSVFSEISESGILTPGEPLGSFYGFVFDGIYQNQAEVDAINDPRGAPGRVKFKDVNGDGAIDSEDRTVIGNAQPDFIWGLTNNLSYKNIDLDFTLQGVQGNEVFWTTEFQLSRVGRESNSLASIRNFWNGEGTSNTVQGLGEGPGDMSSRYIHDGSYIRLQNLSLGFNFPRTLLDRLKIQAAKVYVSGQNLFTITNYPGYDPEVNSRGGNDNLSNQNILLGYDHGGFPGVKIYNIGLNLTF